MHSGILYVYGRIEEIKDPYQKKGKENDTSYYWETVRRGSNSMKDSKYRAQKLFTLLFSAMLCFVLMPVSTIAFAETSTCEHELAVVEAVEATCQHTGHLAYRQCTKCGTVFDAIENTEDNKSYRQQKGTYSHMEEVYQVSAQEYRRHVY